MQRKVLTDAEGEIIVYRKTPTEVADTAALRRAYEEQVILVDKLMPDRRMGETPSRETPSRETPSRETPSREVADALREALGRRRRR